MKTTELLRVCIASAVVIGLVCSIPITAQVKDNLSISGTVLTPDAVGIDGASVEIYRENGRRSKAKRTVRTDSEGEFRFFNLADGDYVIRITDQHFGPETQRSLTIKDGRSVDVKVMLGKACTESYDSGPDKTDHFDKAQVVNLAITDTISRLLPSSERKGPVIVSSRNIQSEWMPTNVPVGLQLMSHASIQETANRAGDFMYLSVSEFRVFSACIAISVDYSWAIRKPSDRIYLGGAGISYEFRKREGKWVGEKVLGWVS